MTDSQQIPRNDKAVNVNTRAPLERSLRGSFQVRATTLRPSMDDIGQGGRVYGC